MAEVLIRKIQDRMGTLRVGSPLDKAIDIGAIVAPVQLQRIRQLVQCGIEEGATCWQPEIQMPANGLYFPADTAEQRAPDLDRCAAGNFWSGTGLDDVPYSRRSGGTREQHRLRVGCKHLEREHQSRAAGRGTGQGGRGLGELDEPCSMPRAASAAIARAVSAAKGDGKGFWNIFSRNGWDGRPGQDPERPRTRKRRCGDGDVGWDAADRSHGETLHRWQTGATRFRL